jgi:heme/copper-type cytochrome/quinol oxidase subunit 3
MNPMRFVISATVILFASFAVGYSGAEALQAGRLDRSMILLFSIALGGIFLIALKRVSV